MSFLGDVFGFEKFQLKDWWDKARKNPEQLLLGGADPLGAKIAGGITGKKYEPFVDQMGGAYGGAPVSAFGNTPGGVYERARDAGINTRSGADMHSGAHVLASIFGGQGLQSAGQGLLGSMQGGAGQGLGVFSNGGTAGMQGVGGGNAGALAQSGGIGGGAGIGSYGGAQALAPQDYMKMAQKMGGQMQQRPQQPQKRPYLVRGQIVWM